MRAPTPTAPPADLTSSPTGEATEASPTPAAPGATAEPIIVTEECQFCILSMSHAVLVIPEAATFEILPASAGSSVSSDTACTSVETMHGRQVVLCHGPSLTAFRLKVCTNPDTCAEVPVALRTCPPVALPTDTPTFTPTPTSSSTSTPEGPTMTPEASPTTGPTETPTP